MSHSISFALSTLLVLVLAACGGTAPTNTPDASSPTEAATQAAQAPAEPEIPPLSQTVTSTTDGVTVSYPDGWLDPLATVGVFLYNNADGQNIMNFMRGRPGGMAFQIGWQPNNTGMSLEEAFDFFLNPFYASLSKTPGELQTFTVDGVEAIKATVADTGAATSLGLYTALKPADDGFITFIAYLDPAEIEQNTPLIEAILASASHAAP